MQDNFRCNKEEYYTSANKLVCELYQISNRDSAKDCERKDQLCCKCLSQWSVVLENHYNIL